MALSDSALVTLIQAKNYLRVDAAASLRVVAEYVGTGNGVNPIFTLDHTPLAGSYEVWVNTAGTPALQVEATDYTLATATITFLDGHIPADGAIVTASYDYAATEDTFESYDDDVLERIIEAATKIAEDFAGRAFVQVEITENRIGNGDRLLSLHRQPIVTVTSVTLDGMALTKDINYIELLDMGWLKHSVGWTKDKAIVVVYTAGYGDTREATQVLIPDAVTAVLLILADLYENRGDTVDSVNISGLGSTSYKLPSRAEKILNNLKPQGGFA